VPPDLPWAAARAVIAGRWRSTCLHGKMVAGPPRPTFRHRGRQSSRYRLRCWPALMKSAIGP